jgi:hypothetical protein
MRIDRVVARAFGPFRGESLDLGPGMNVVAGPNEAGKSSWHAALRLALTGVRRGKGPGTNAERLLAERHRPWDEPDRWEVEARLALDDGRAIDISQDLAGKVACRATDVALGRDVSDEILDGTPDASRWLGLTRDSFAATVCVSQAQIMSVADAADDLQHQMQRAAATRGTDATAAEAIGRLEQFRRDAVGADTIAAKGPLRAAGNRLATAEATLTEADRLHEAYLEQGAALEAAERDASQVRARLAALEAGLAELAAAQLAERLARAEELATRYPTRPAPIAAQHEEARLVDGALEAWVSRPTAAPLGGPTAAELESEIDALPPAPDGDRRVHADVAEARHVLEIAVETRTLHGAAPQGPGATPETDIGTVRDLARRLREPQLPHAAALEMEAERARAAAEQHPRLDLRIAGSAVATGLVGLALLALGLSPAGGLALLVAAGIAAWTWRASTGGRAARARLRRAEAALEPYRDAARLAQSDRNAAAVEARAAGLPTDPASLDELADRLAQRDRLAAEQDAWEARRRSLDTRIEVAREALRAALSARGVEAGADPLVAFDAYALDCERRAAQAELAAQAETLRSELVHRRAAEQAAEEAQRACSLAEQRLRDAAGRVGVPGEGESDALVSAVRAWRETREEQLRRGEVAIAEWQELSALLEGTSLDGLRSAAADRAGIARGLGASLPQGASPATGDAASLDARIARTRVELADALRTADSLAGSLSARREGVPEVAEAEEAVAAARHELERVQRLAATIDEALRLLRAAEEQVHRNLAPVLAGAIRRWLPQVSGGAYDEVSVDPSDLAVAVKESGTGQWRQARLLSEGTREQIYLLLRVAMAEHLVTTGERAPLLLDEVTAQSDAARKRQLLEVLHHISADRQVILFSHDDDVAQWAAEALRDDRDRLVRLDRVPGGVRRDGAVAGRPQATHAGDRLPLEVVADPATA